MNNIAQASDDVEGIADVTKSKPHKRVEHFRMFDGVADEKVTTKSLSTREKSKEDIMDDDEWESADMDDFDEFATTDEEVVEVQTVFRKRERPSGVQYLVTAPGKDAGEAKWVLQTKLISVTAQIQIEDYEKAEAVRADFLAQASEASPGESDDELLNDVLDDAESEANENERIVEQTSRMTDEQIARALAMQEELGMNADEVLLLDGQAEGPRRPQADDNLMKFSARSYNSHTRSKKHQRHRDSFPSAEAFADALDEDPYGGFDVMDFERPSLKPKKKGSQVCRSKFRA